MVKPFFRFCLGGLLVISSLCIFAKTAVANQRISLTVQADGVSSYRRLLDLVMAAANDAIANALETDTEPVELIVLVNRNGQILPILMAEVTHEDWQQQPNVENWARYSNSVPVLLGYEQPVQVPTRPQSPVRRRPIIANSELIDALD